MAPDIDIQRAGVTIRGCNILDSIDFRVERGSFWGIVGPNGSGKTTLIRMILGFVKPSAGKVTVLGYDTDNCRLNELRQRAGFLPQSLSYSPGLPMCALDIIMIGRSGRRGLFKRLNSNDLEKARNAAALLDISHLLERNLDHLSGGERQLVQLARAMAQEPEILILDEPANNLDPRAAAAIIDTLEKLAGRTGITVLMITHQIEHLPPCCRNLLLLKNGRVFDSGAKEQMIVSSTMSKLYGREVVVDNRAGYYHLSRGGVT